MGQGVDSSLAFCNTIHMKTIKPLPLLTELRSWLDYDPQSGVFCWKKGPRAGSRAGCLDKSTGYWNIKVCRQRCKAHRLAWKMSYGSDPALLIDHINGDKSDNRLENLQCLSNRDNTTKSKDSGLGVDAHQGRWRARLRLDGRQVHIGMFATKAEAAKAVQDFKQKHLP